MLAGIERQALDVAPGTFVPVDDEHVADDRDVSLGSGT